MRKYDKNGFILIEICIGMLIISIAVLLLGSTIQSFHRVEASKDSEGDNEDLLKELYKEE